MNSLKKYNQKKQRLIYEMLTAHQGGYVTLKKSTSNLFRHRHQKNTRKIDVQQFNHVIHVDAKKMTAEVEGMTTYESLVDETLKHGLMPCVVPQLKSITIGGAATGLGIESSSFRFGLTHETITEMEILLSDGKTIVCTRNNKNSDLFFGFPNSYGTLGYALKIKCKLIPTKKYVKLEHLRYTNSIDFFHDLEKFSREKKVDFIDGTIFSADELFITLGSFIDEAEWISDYTYMNIYYRSIQEKKTDYLTTRDYLWRWDTDWFWCSKHFLVQNPILRFLWGKKRLRSTTYSRLRALSHKYPLLEKLSALTGQTESVVQDVEIPIENCVPFMKFFHKKIGIKPIWVCPLAAHDKKTSYDLYPLDPHKLYMNFGFWDVIKTNYPDGHYNKIIEKKVSELNGKKSLYSTSYYSKEEFWKQYHKQSYDRLKAKYAPSQVFPDLYEKCVMRK